MDIDGRHVIQPLETKINIPVPVDQQSGSMNLILNIQGLKVERWGEHSIDLAVDGRQESTLPLFIRDRTKFTRNTEV
jgi:hypothetical protein